MSCNQRKLLQIQISVNVHQNKRNVIKVHLTACGSVVLILSVFCVCLWFFFCMFAVLWNEFFLAFAFAFLNERRVCYRIFEHSAFVDEIVHGFKHPPFRFNDRVKSMLFSVSFFFYVFFLFPFDKSTVPKRFSTHKSDQLSKANMMICMTWAILKWIFFLFACIFMCVSVSTLTTATTTQQTDLKRKNKQSCLQYKAFSSSRCEIKITSTF